MTIMAVAVVAAVVLTAGKAASREGTGGAPGRSAADTVTAAITPRPCTSGTCWVAVSVATMWVHPWSPRPVDRSALGNPAKPRAWVAGMTNSDKAGLQGRVESQALYGTKVIVIGHPVSGYTGWTRIAVPSQPTNRDGRGYPGWVPTKQLTSTRPPTAGTTAVVTAPTAWLWSGWNSAGVAGSRVMEISYDTALPVLRATSRYVVVKLIDGRQLALRRSYVKLHTSGSAWGGTGAKVVSEARKFMGLAYLWGGTSGFGFDCSGLTHSIFLAYGVTIPRDADRQFVRGTAVASNALRPGDLVFFREGGSGPVGHVGLYIGGGNMINAPHTGASVRIDSVWSFGNYAGARRYLPS
jgi:hypothetical protein